MYLLPSPVFFMVGIGCVAGGGLLVGGGGGGWDPGGVMVHTFFCTL